MKIITESIQLDAKADMDLIDITGKIEEKLSSAGLKEGNVTVFTKSSTSAIITMEYEPGLLKDIPEALERLFPSDKRYAHDSTWGDGNGFSHVRASFLSPSLTVPFRNGKLLLGTWQHVVFLHLDNKPRNREIFLQFVGE
jgi:secondary thiamine-phosphate synthase enzyme